MAFTLTLTGSYPPVRLPPPSLTEEEIEKSIANAVRQQMEAVGDRSVNWLFVDGQPRSDIVGIFSRGLGLSGEGLPYEVADQIRYEGPITLHDLQTATKAADGAPLKAHITGPSLLAESCGLAKSSPSRYRDDPQYPRQLIFDFAEALAEEARQLLENANELNIHYLQIDEPTLAYGSDLELASESIGIITECAQAVGITTILHTCGDIGDVMEHLLKIPVDILSVESKHLRNLSWLNADLLAHHEKKLSIGCIPVNVDEIPTVRWLERELLFAANQFGPQNIWGITPDCGLRMSDPSLARARLNRLVEVGLAVSSRFER